MKINNDFCLSFLSLGLTVGGINKALAALKNDAEIWVVISL